MSTRSLHILQCCTSSSAVDRPPHIVILQRPSHRAASGSGRSPFLTPCSCWNGDAPPLTPYGESSGSGAPGYPHSSRRAVNLLGVGVERQFSLPKSVSQEASELPLLPFSLSPKGVARGRLSFSFILSKGVYCQILLPLLPSPFHRAKQRHVMTDCRARSRSR